MRGWVLRLAAADYRRGRRIRQADKESGKLILTALSSARRARKKKDRQSLRSFGSIAATICNQ
jgi:hypothetical protein